MAIFFALLCLISAAVNDLVFKLYARKSRSKGYFATLVGVFWLLVTVWLPVAPGTSWGMSILWGGISGFFSITANLLLLEAMERLGGGLCATIYRLNMVPAVVGAAVLLHETLTASEWCGIALAVGAVLSFLPPRGGKQSNFAMGGFLMVLAAAFLRAAMGLSYKFGLLNGADANMIVMVNSFFWIVGGLIYAYLREKHPSIREQPHLLRYGAGAGFMTAAICLTMAAALKYGEASVVLPIAQMSFLLTFICSAWFLHEKMRRTTIIGLACGIGAVLLLSL